MEILIKSFESQYKALLFIKKFTSLMHKRPISVKENGRYVIYIDAKDKQMYDMLHKAGKL